MIVWRVIGSILLLAGLSVLVRDVIAGFDTGVWRPIAVGQLWYDVDRSSLNLVQAVTQRYVSPFLWNQVVVPVLLCWASAVLIGLGAFVLAAHPATTACGTPDRKTARGINSRRRSNPDRDRAAEAEQRQQADQRRFLDRNASGGG